MNNNLRLLEAFLFASSEPLSTQALQEQFPNDVAVEDLLGELHATYEGRGVELVQTGDLWSFRTAADLADQMTITKQPRRKLPRAAGEVLAIIAYHQPVTRAEMEAIRGVETSRGTLDILLELGWIRPGKRRETPGRPLTWKTTPDFLSYFNLENLKDLPGIEDLKASGLLDAKPVMATLSDEAEEDSEAEDASRAAAEQDEAEFGFFATDDEEKL